MSRLGLPVAAAVLTAGLAVPSAHAAGPDLTAVLTLAGHGKSGALGFARRHGWQVVRAGTRSLTVVGPADELAAAFHGVVRHGSSGTWVDTVRVPGELRSEVTRIVGLDSRRLHTPHTSRPLLTGDGQPNPQTASTLRSAYDLPPTWRGAGLTVGVVNLAGWDRTDLDVFAEREVITLAPGQVTEVPVGLEPTQLDGFGSEYEVALDSQAVLAAAPEARQRLYFAPNTSGGVVSAFEQVADDAENGLVQVVTTSWGSCERLFNQVESPAELAAYQDAIDRVVAAGATLFAASGDAAAFDCSSLDQPDGEAQVDFPASYPNTVAVGGTTLTVGLPETAWYDQGFGDYLGSGSGGGESVEQPLPEHQAGLVPGAVRRVLPDVAADADPQSGLQIYVRSQGGWSSAGGTSLASPLWAGMLASALSSDDRTTGLGNILPALYVSASDPVSPGLRDVTEGHNGLFPAGPGYDQVTGLGVPTWPDLAADLLAVTPGLPTDVTTDPITRPAPSDEVVLRSGWTRTLTAPVAVTVPEGSSYSGFAVGETVPACARLQPDPPTTAQLDADPYEGEHELTLTALDSARVCHVVRAPVG